MGSTALTARLLLGPSVRTHSSSQYTLTRLTGSVYIATDIFNRRLVAVKLESVESESPSLQDEYRIYTDLNDMPGIPAIYWFGPEYEHDAIVMELLGPSLEDVFNRSGRKFNLETAVGYAERMVRLVLRHGKYTG